MLKRTLTAVAIIVAVSGLALANIADVTQDGAGNSAAINQAGADNTATVDQYGTNLAQVDQTGNRNAADVDQGASGSPVTNFHIPAYAGDHWMGAYIVQTGDDNIASTNQRRSSTYSHINQDGNRNTGSQDINTSSSSANSAYVPKRGVQIDQTGDDNQAYQTTLASYGCYGIQNMQILQIGNSNIANQTSIGGTQSVMEIFQTGSSNNSTQYSDGMIDRAHASMTGDGNTTDQQQPYTLWGNTNRVADIDIEGHDNAATQYQLGVSNVADIDIIGDLNQAYQSQSGDSNYAKIDVLGSSNYASQTQTGGSQSSTVTQTGDGNVANVVQGP